ncbi:MAG: TrkA C-terminal domain-containing protein, partial [Lachnospiraceae bacterium]|nr:TrkA C-terminal domain-containing protein [Lachnospiraceae bacterium]
LKRYLRITVVYGILMLACTVVGHYLLLPLLLRLPISSKLARLICLVLVYLAMALFVRPFMDTHSFAYTKLWVAGGTYRAGLMALTAIRVVLIVLIAFIPLHRVAGASGLFILPLVAAGLLLLSRSGWLAARYINAEARFMANFNERSLTQATTEAVTQMLDERLMVSHFVVFAGYRIAGKTLKDLAWGKRYDVNIIKIIRGGVQTNMPTGEFVLEDGDEVYVIGESENITTLYAKLGGWQQPEQMTLREYIADEGEASDLYSYPIAVEKGSSLAGKSIKDCGLKKDYDCMILGLQRNMLPIPTPDIHTVISAGDQVWVLGTKFMADKLKAAEMVPASDQERKGGTGTFFGR